ncbi:MAG TPA: hypothetical protein VN681_12290 [Stellaceae bacterium]|nr:hypothetical protein [Stellaceae bacterium]
MEHFDPLENLDSRSTRYFGNSNVSRRRRRLARLRRRLPGALLSLALVWTGEAPPADAPHVAAAAADDSGCLSIQTDRSGQVTSFSNSDRSTGACARTSTKLPLAHDTVLGSGLLSSDIELSNLDFGTLTAQEVKLKFGVSRGVIAGINATIDGSFGRVLGMLSPIFDEQVRVGLNRPLDAHWETGLEGHVSALGSIGVTQLTERTGLIFLRARYTLFPWRVEDEQHLVLKLSADSWQTVGLGSGRRARADLRYEYRRDANILSIGLNTGAADGDPSIVPVPAFRIDVRATRPF